MTRRVQLICEGACNPDVGGLDTQVQTARGRGAGEGPLPPLENLFLVEALHSMRHTWHRPTNYAIGAGRIWSCEKCGCGRRW